MTVEERLAKLEKRHGATTGVLWLAILVLIGVTAYQAYRIYDMSVTMHDMARATSLRVKELRIYDDKGVDRVILAGSLPQPLLDGKAYHTPPRSMAGMLIYDGSGTERGGYGTADGYANAMLTLDAEGHQVMLLMAEPDGGAFFRQQEGLGSVTMGTYGSPFLTLMDDKTVVLAKPENNVWTKRGMK